MRLPIFAPPPIQAPQREAGAAPFWSRSADDLLAALRTADGGLAPGEAARRLASGGPNVGLQEGSGGLWRLVVRQVLSPLVLILLFASCVSMILREWVDATIILAILLATTAIGIAQEARASRAIEALKARLALTADVLRGGLRVAVPVEEVVPGDVVLLSAGSLVPADGLVLEATDFLVTEASLTGESFPVEKRPGIAARDAPVSERTNAVFVGSSVRSGTARVLAVATGRQTEFAAIAARFRAPPPETAFERGLRRFGGMLLTVMVLMVLFVLAVNIVLGRGVADSLLFAVALAVGLSPELLPAIVSVTLSTGARDMARRGVIVRRLNAIENLGSIDVLCTDKTGTLTEGTVAFSEALDPAGRPSERVRRLAHVNAAFETGITNPLDTAILAEGERAHLSVDALRKVDEIPYDFLRRRLTIVVADEADTRLLVTKGALASVLEVSTRIATAEGDAPLDAAGRAAIDALFRARSAEGLRVLGLASARVPVQADYGPADEAGLVFEGLVAFADPPRPDAAAALQSLGALGIATKVVTGDNRHVAAHIAAAVGLDASAMLTGAEVARMRDEALVYAAPRTTLFVEIDPQQKERIVRSLQKAGHAVGYLGDGINDAPALVAADVGISIDAATDAARASADIVMVARDLDILREGVVRGRKAFANTLKYIAITTSANFGNMTSMALATPFLPFLPLLPKQILLNNFLSDLPSMALATDAVDPEVLAVPRVWDIRDLVRFMVIFGLISSAIDMASFFGLIVLLDADETTFRTTWFVLSLLTELLVVLLLRSHRPVLRTRPGRLLLAATILVMLLCVALPYAGEAARLFGFAPLGPGALLFTLAMWALYGTLTEFAKLRLAAAARARSVRHPLDLDQPQPRRLGPAPVATGT